jgi:hypothetical protein
MAGGKGNTTSNNILKLIFNATAWANIADNAAASPNTNIYIALHTSSPAASGTQTTNEAAYTSYVRVAVARTTGGWTAASAQSTSPVANITFAQATGGSETETYFSAGMLSSGAGIILYFGTVTPNIAVSNGVTPQLTTASTISEA